MTRFTSYAWVVLAWLLVCAFQYGYSISALNQLQAVITCRDAAPEPGGLNLPSCIPMTDATFSLVTSIFTLGGLAGSLGANIVLDQHGRKKTVRLSSALNCAGSLVMSAASSVTLLLIGRFIVGIASGIGLCVVPLFLSELSPPSRKDKVGLFNQLSIVTGILITQLFGFVLAVPSTWRLVFLVSAALSAAQFLLSLGSAMVDSPAWLAAQNRTEEARSVQDRLWNDGRTVESAPAEDEETLLLQSAEPVTSPEAVSLWQCLKRDELRRPLIVICGCMLLGQFSGINAVLYYSTNILSATLPSAAAYLSLGITLVNALMTFPPLFFIDRVGKKKFLFLSIGGITLSLVALGFAMNAGYDILASVAIVSFVAMFAVGLGPIAFVIIPDISPFYAASAISSVSFSLSWIANFVVGATFLPLRNALSNPDGTGTGRVFYLSAALVVLFALTIYRWY